MGKVMKRDGGLVEAMGGCRPPTPAPAGWVRPWTLAYPPRGGPICPEAGLSVPRRAYLIPKHENPDPDTPRPQRTPSPRFQARREQRERVQDLFPIPHTFWGYKPV